MVVHAVNIGIFVLLGIFLQFLKFRDIIRRYLGIKPVVLNVRKIVEPSFHQTGAPGNVLVAGHQVVGNGELILEIVGGHHKLVLVHS